MLDEAADAHGTANPSSDLPELLKHFVEIDSTLAVAGGTSRATGLPLRWITNERPLSVSRSNSERRVFASNAPILVSLPVMSLSPGDLTLI